MSNLKQPTPWLRPVVEYGPIVVFFIVYYTAGLFVATASIMITTVFTLSLSYILERHIPTMPLITAGIIGVFGGLTLWLQDETFIKMKPTIITLIFGAVLVGGLMANCLFLKSLMGSAWQMSDEGWRLLTLRFSWLFFLKATLNEVIWRTQSTDFWVNFKVFGLASLTFIFILTQLPLLKRFATEEIRSDKPNVNPPD